MTEKIDLNERIMLALIVPPQVGSLAEMRTASAMRERLLPTSEDCGTRWDDLRFEELRAPGGGVNYVWDRDVAAEITSEVTFSDAEAALIGEGIAMLAAQKALPTRDPNFSHIVDMFEASIPEGA